MAQRLTKTFVDSIPLLAEGQAFYRDADLKGFGLRVGARSKVYIAEGKLHGRTVRVTIGKHGVFTTEEARIQARVLLGQLASGVNPNDVSKEVAARQVTLEAAYADFIQARKNLKSLTIRDYDRCMRVFFSDWKRKAIVDINKDMVERRHLKIGEVSPAQANLAMRFLRSLLNFAAGKYEDSKGNPILPDNPVRRISQTRAWYRVDRRQGVVKAHELGPWIAAVLKQGELREATLIRDYLLLILFTGLRRGEAARLQWKDVDLVAKTLTIPDTKNHEDHTLPLSDFLFDLLDSRKKCHTSEYVFPGDGAAGYIVEPRKFMQKVTEQTGIEFTLHDLRRTFITVAESLDISAYALKRLLNHKMRNDVTAGYIVADVERLRIPMQKITDYMLKAAGIRGSATVVEINQYSNGNTDVLDSLA